jgi:Flp pilus assembly protein TadD
MKRLVAAFALCALLSAPAALAQTQDQPPPQCRYNSAGQVDYAACAAAAAPGTPWRILSLINLGTQAVMRGDYAAAVRYYDEAQPTNGDTFYSDPSYHAYHAYRASALQQVGRADEALVEARRSLDVLNNDASLPEDVRRRFGQFTADRELLYTLLLPVLHAGNAPETEALRREYVSMPARDWVSWANRAGVLEQVGDLAGALAASEQAMRLEPNQPAVLNNHCYILTRAERAAEGLPYCERAVVGAPDVASVRHSLAVALAQLGRCEDAQAALAEARRLDPVSVEYAQPIVCAAR